MPRRIHLLRNLLSVLIGGALILLASVANAGDYRSSFGFGISVPEAYLVLTRSEVTEKSDLFLEGDESGGDRLAPVEHEMRQAVFDQIEAGELEIFYRQEGLSDGFVDNVNVMLQPAGLPASKAELRAVCGALPQEFSRVFGRPIGMDSCEFRQAASRPALYLQFDGAVPGTTTLQYQLQRGPRETLVLTATAAAPNLTRMLSEFEEMVASIRID